MKIQFKSNQKGLNSVLVRANDRLVWNSRNRIRQLNWIKKYKKKPEVYLLFFGRHIWWNLFTGRLTTSNMKKPTLTSILFPFDPCPKHLWFRISRGKQRSTIKNRQRILWWSQCQTIVLQETCYDLWLFSFSVLSLLLFMTHICHTGHVDVYI